MALITGGSRGIGRAIALGLAKDGFAVWCTYVRDDKAAEETRAAVEALGAPCRLLRFDVTDGAAVRAALTPLLETTTPYALVNNAGFAKDGMFGLMSDVDWQSVLDVHLQGFFHVTRLLVPHMQRARAGRIVVIASVSGLMGVAGQVNYSAAKAGLIGATKALARELGPRNILVNAVAPGLIETDMTRDLPVDEYCKVIPLRRQGKAEEVAGCVRFLCSPLSSYVTGQVLAVSGGLAL